MVYRPVASTLPGGLLEMPKYRHRKRPRIGSVNWSLRSSRPHIKVQQKVRRFLVDTIVL